MRRIIIDVMYSQIQVAIVKDNQLIHYFIEKESKGDNYGDIYMGRVEQIKPGIQGAFVNIGEEKNALLHLRDISSNSEDLPINKILKQGEELIVQVKKEAVSDKGARLTTKFSISGHFLVLLPKENNIFVSKKIADKDEIKRLKEGLINAKPPEFGLIIRTEAWRIEIDTLLRELDHLLKKWRQINTVEKAPKQLLKDANIIFRTIRDYYTTYIDEIVVNEALVLEDLKEYFRVYFPLDTHKIKYIQDENLIRYYQLNNKIQNLYKRKIWLKSGGYIIIDYTEAFTVIDVNSGKFTGKKNLNETGMLTNLEATEVIGNQIRLRNISGIILIDYINIHKELDQKKILEKWTEILAIDKVRTKIHGFTELSILQLTRQQLGKSLHDFNSEECNICNGTGWIPNQEALFYQCLGLIESNGDKVRDSVTVRVSPYLKNRIEEMDSLNKQNSFIYFLKDYYNINVFLEEDPYLVGMEMKVF